MKGRLVSPAVVAIKLLAGRQIADVVHLHVWNPTQDGRGEDSKNIFRALIATDSN